MEIGADKGGGFYHWCKCFSTVEKAIAIEIRGLPYAKIFEQHFPQIEFCWVESSSYSPDTVQVIREFLLGVPIDVLFIDGDKLSANKDYSAYKPLVRSGGFIFIHDVNGEDGEEPSRMFKDLDHPCKSIVLDQSESHEALARESRGEPVTTPYEGWLRYWKGLWSGVGVIRV
jgi:hypothetical protein